MPSADDPNVLLIPIPTPSDSGGANNQPTHGVSAMPIVDMSDANQSLAQGRLGHSMQRQSDMADLYGEDSRRHYLTELGRLNQANAIATRHIDESGSGIARQLAPILFAASGGTTVAPGS